MSEKNDRANVNGREVADGYRRSVLADLQRLKEDNERLRARALPGWADAAGLLGLLLAPPAAGAALGALGWPEVATYAAGAAACWLTLLVLCPWLGRRTP